ncbi:hypothetical protein QVD17_02263 [Tagetes erecta]|uniref:Uncharacterized protein n=1 Tax=Tagetes erecta TaxID=13708 RepID=A0AAD8L8W0_TARER|nr:hypothetical protein QVD17_02263 [Tagetes erecta]
MYHAFSISQTIAHHILFLHTLFSLVPNHSLKSPLFSRNPINSLWALSSKFILSVVYQQLTNFFAYKSWALS